MDEQSLSERVGDESLPSRRVVVGVDDSASASKTLSWASREATARQCALNVVACPNGASDSHAALLDRAIGAELLIVTASTTGSGQDWLYRSVRGTRARRSSCPLVIIRGSVRQGMDRIVVGLDSSSAALAAMEWAIEAANRHLADLTIVNVWQRRTGTNSSVRDNDLRFADARCVVDNAVASCKQRCAQTVRGHVAEGDPATVLSDVSNHADLLVVGSRGRSGYLTMLFGSVALSIADHADCPIAVIHPGLNGSIR